MRADVLLGWGRRASGGAGGIQIGSLFLGMINKVTDTLIYVRLTQARPFDSRSVRVRLAFAIDSLWALGRLALGSCLSGVRCAAWGASAPAPRRARSAQGRASRLRPVGSGPRVSGLGFRA